MITIHSIGNLPALLALSAASFATAQEIGPVDTSEAFNDITNYGAPTRGPFEIPLSTWDDYFDNPDATGSVSLPIPDMTRRFISSALLGPSSSSSSDSFSPDGEDNKGAGWSWSIALKSNIPISSSSEAEEEQVTAGVQINLNAPPGLTEEVDDTWQLCVMTWHLKGGTNTSTYEDMRRYDDCSSMLSRQCIRALEEYAAGDGSMGKCQCPDPLAIESCEGMEFPQWSVCNTQRMSSSLISYCFPSFPYLAPFPSPRVPWPRFPFSRLPPFGPPPPYRFYPSLLLPDVVQCANPSWITPPPPPVKNTKPPTSATGRTTPLKT